MSTVNWSRRQLLSRATESCPVVPTTAKYGAIEQSASRPATASSTTLGMAAPYFSYSVWAPPPAPPAPAAPAVPPAPPAPSGVVLEPQPSPTSAPPSTPTTKPARIFVDSFIRSSKFWLPTLGG